MQTSFLQRDRDLQPVLLEHAERALRFLEVATQKQEHGQPFGQRAPCIAVKNAAGAGGVTVKVDRWMNIVVRPAWA